MSGNHNQLLLLYLADKQDTILQHCYQKCGEKGKAQKSSSSRQQSCVENCQIKMINAYSHLYTIVRDGGIYRGTQGELKNMIL